MTVVGTEGTVPFRAEPGARVVCSQGCDVTDLFTGVMGLVTGLDNICNRVERQMGRLGESWAQVQRRLDRVMELAQFHEVDQKSDVDGNP